jgi:hypothetical protein
LFTASGDHIWFGTTYGDIYRSSDKGFTWTKHATGFPANVVSTARQDISDIAFTDAMNGIIIQVATAGPTLYVKQTTDGGATWTDIFPAGDPLFTSDIEGIPGTSVLMSSGSSQAFGFGTSTSFDNGLTWTNLDLLQESHTAISFADNTSGWTGRYVLATDTTMGAHYYIGSPLAVINQFDKTRETQVYPNPSNGNIYVLAEAKSKSVTFEIFDLQGKKVYSETITPAAFYNHKLALGNISDGLYVLKITDGIAVSQHKVIIH